MGWGYDNYEASDALGDRCVEEWQTDAFGQGRTWFDLMGL